MDAEQPTAAADKGMLTTDTQLIIQVWDGWLARVTGISAEHAVGQPLTALVPDLAERGLLARFKRVLEHGMVEVLVPSFHRYLILCPPQPPAGQSSHMWQRATLAPLREDSRIVGVLAVIEDVTARFAQPPELASADPQERVAATQTLAAADQSDPLLPALDDADWRVRRAAVEGLIRQDSAQAVAELLRAIRAAHHSLGVLNSALQILALTNVDVVPPLIELLQDPDPAIRTYTILALSDHPDPRTAAALIEALNDPDANVQFHAIDALRKLRIAAAVEPLLALAESGDFFLAFPALEALREIGGALVPRLLPLLQHELLHLPVIDILGEQGDLAAVPILVGLLEDPAAPAAAIIAALALIYQRTERIFGSGEQIAEAVRGAWQTGATSRLLGLLATTAAADLPVLVLVLGWLDDPTADQALVQLITHPVVQGSVVEALVRHGGRIVSLLLDQLRAAESERRLASAAALGRIGSAQAVPALIAALDDEEEIAAAAARSLAQIGDPQAFEPLLGLLDAEDADVRQAAIAAINSLGHPATGERLDALLSADNPVLRESAVRIAGYFGLERHLGHLVTAASDADERVRQAAIEHLAYLDDPQALPTVAAALRGDSAKVRAAAARALAYAEADQALPHLLAALHDPDSWVRYFAIGTLGWHQYAAAVEPIISRIQADPAFQVRLAGLKALGQIGGPQASRLLIDYIGHEHAELALAALAALDAAPAADALPALLDAARAADAERRGAAVRALRHYADGQSIAALEWAAAADSADEVRQAALRALVAQQSPAAIAALAGLLIDAARRPAVIEALTELAETAIPQLGTALAHPHPAVRRALVEVLTRLKRPQASELLLRALDDAEPTVRLAAIRALSQLGSLAAQTRLAALATTDPAADVRAAAAAALRL